MKKPPPYPPPLAQALIETCGNLELPPSFPMEHWAHLEAIGLLAGGAAYVFEQFLRHFRRINKAAKLWVIGNSPDLTEHVLLKHDTHVEFIAPPTTHKVEDFLVFHKAMQSRAIDPWVVFLESENGLSENLQLIDRLTEKTAYFYTPKQKLIPMTLEERGRHMETQKRLLQLNCQHWASLPLWEPALLANR